MNPIPKNEPSLSAFVGDGDFPLVGRVLDDGALEDGALEDGALEVGALEDEEKE